MRETSPFVEGNKHVPFELQRLYYLYDIPGGEDRGAHAHKELYQLVVAASGSFDVLLDDGENKKIVTLKPARLRTDDRAGHLASAV